MDTKNYKRINPSQLTYEKAVKRLEEITNTLSKKTQSNELDEAINLFEEGTELTDYCRTQLTNAQQKINEIKKVSNLEELDKIKTELKDR